VAAHAAASPERGRSALDGVEAMNHMANMMREHVPDSTRIHYVITKGGEAPNVVPAFAEVYYYVRSPSRETVAEVWGRLEDAARGAALGTGTKADWEVVSGVYERMGNEPLGRLMQQNLDAVGGVTYDEKEKAFATKIGQTVFGKPPALEIVSMIEPFHPNPPREATGSTDVGDVSWIVPTMGVRTACFAPGAPSHSWQSAACAGTTLGLKGMAVAAKTMAGTAIDLYQQPAVIKAAKADFEKRRGSDFKYAPLLGDRPPALNYRD
jgi:aminobenzoyl-glutamate utilization protein B